ncbi:MAG: hypothetical protein KDA32_06330 [Phycisphaerales bacterium]|nr:hypothetical protein [Phycisphaerales bacterium]
MFDELKARGFDVLALHHAEAILTHDLPEAAAEIETVLIDLEIPAEELVRGGGGEAPATQRLRQALAARGWRKHNFEVKKIIDGEERESITHEIDHVKRFGSFTAALEIEWNNKDPFFDRDLENYKRLHADGVISIGMIVTRGTSLHDEMREIVRGFAEARQIDTLEKLEQFYEPTSRQIDRIQRATVGAAFAAGWARVFVADKFGEATTHWRKLIDRVDRGVGNPCPLLLIGIPSSIVRP